jgi:hypothetical protein
MKGFFRAADLAERDARGGLYADAHDATRARPVPTPRCTVADELAGTLGGLAASGNPANRRGASLIEINTPTRRAAHRARVHASRSEVCHAGCQHLHS